MPRNAGRSSKDPGHPLKNEPGCFCFANPNLLNTKSGFGGDPIGLMSLSGDHLPHSPCPWAEGSEQLTIIKALFPALLSVRAEGPALFAGGNGARGAGVRDTARRGSGVYHGPHINSAGGAEWQRRRSHRPRERLEP